MSTKKIVFLSYDLGLKGDYNGLYTWLDSQAAKECGGSLALFEREFSDNDHKKFFSQLKSELSKEVKIEANDRIYVMVRGKDGSVKGKFIFGGRKQAPWSGFAVSHYDAEDSD